MTLRSYRYKVQKAGFGLFLGIKAEVARLATPPAVGAPVSGRVWLDASEVENAFYGNRLELNEREIGWLRHGLGKVSDGIERVETRPYLLIGVRALEIVEVDYHEVALAPAIVGWATEEFALQPRTCVVRRDGATGRLAIEWNE
ncbi:hypothetical protein ACWDYJ_35615 [Streptomyces sp. NPDC003042]